MTRVYLGDICDFINGGAWSDKEYVEEGIPVLKVTNCKTDSFSLEDIDYLPLSAANTYAQHRLCLHDVVIATVGSHPTLEKSAAGRAVIINESVQGFYLNQNAVCLRSKSETVLNQRYLGYLARSFEFRNFIQMRGRGAANQMRIAIGSIKQFEFQLPDIHTQRRIADILSAYDDLIENNQKQIKLQEEAAQRLYREWFVELRFPGHETTRIVDGVPEGWEQVTVGSCLDKVERTKQVMTADLLAVGAIPVVDQSRDFVAGYTNDWDTVVDLARPVIVFGDHTRVLKYIQFPFAKGADGTQLLVSNNPKMPQSLLHCSLVNVDLSNHHYARHFKYLKAEEILMPSLPIAEAFNGIAQVLFTQVQMLRDKCTLAAEARDRLLPKLMSGEVEV